MTPQEYPLILQLVLCELVHEASADSTWEDITNKFMQRHVVIRLHHSLLNTLKEEITPQTIPNIVASIVNHTLQTLSRSGKRDSVAAAAAARQYEEISGDPKLEQFITSGNKERESLVRCCTILHNLCVKDVKEEIETRKAQFSKILKEEKLV